MNAALYEQAKDTESDLAQLAKKAFIKKKRKGAEKTARPEFLEQLSPLSSFLIPSSFLSFLNKP